MTKLISKSFDSCEEFYRMYAKSKGFGVRRNGVCKSGTDGHPTLRLFKCSAKGMCLEMYLKNSDKKRRPKK